MSAPPLVRAPGHPLQGLSCFNSVSPLELEQVYQRYMPVMLKFCDRPEPDVFPKHREADIFVPYVSVPSDFLLYLRRTCDHKVYGRHLGSISAVMSWCLSALDQRKCSRFIELRWPAVLNAVDQYDDRNPTPTPYVIFLKAFCDTYIPRLEEGELYASYLALYEGGEFSSMDKLHTWCLSVRAGAHSVLGTDSWADKAERDRLQFSKRLPIDIVLQITALPFSGFMELLDRLQRVVRHRLSLAARRGGVRVHDVAFVADDDDVSRLSKLEQQVAALSVGDASSGRSKGASSSAKGRVGRNKTKSKNKDDDAPVSEASGSSGGKRACFACGGAHFIQDCQVFKSFKDASN